MQELLRKNTHFIYEKEIEYLLAGTELLCNYGLNPKIREVYTEEFTEAQKDKFPLLFELFEQMDKNYGMELFEFLLDFKVCDFSIESYFAHIKSLSKTEFLSRFLQHSMPVSGLCWNIRDFLLCPCF